MARPRIKALSTDQIDLTKLPTDKIANKARAILNSISSGICYTVHKGKRLKYNRQVISVPLTHRYRIIYDYNNGTPTPRMVMSHEEYNARKPAS